MKFFHTLAAALLFLPALINAQSQNGTINVSGVLSAVSTIRSIDAPLGSSWPRFGFRTFEFHCGQWHQRDIHFLLVRVAPTIVSICPAMLIMRCPM
jgi:hypothetical protein